MSDLSSLQNRMNLRAKAFKQVVGVIMRTYTFEIGREIITDTPQDTGRAASNWRVGIGRPTRQNINPYSPGKHLGLGNAANVNPAVSLLAKRLQGFKVSGDNVIFISNNVPYISKLDAGVASKQTRPLIVKRGIKRGIKVARRRLTRKRLDVK